MGATRLPVIVNPGADPGRNQVPKPGIDMGAVRRGQYRDPQSMVHNCGGAATTRRTWFAGGREPDSDVEEHEAVELADYNGPAPRDRSNRA
jgi:hypothetical protein